MKCIRLLSASLLFSLALTNRADASSASDIAAASEGLLMVSGGGLVSHTATEADFISAFEKAVGSSLRVCDGAEVGSYPYRRTSQGFRYHISSDRVQLLLEHEDYIKRWLSQTVPSLVPSGVSREAAIRLIYDYILSNYRYDPEALRNPAMLAAHQGAYQMLQTGRGICSSFSKLFRGMVEYVPFSPEGISDYSSPRPSRLQVIVIDHLPPNATGHEWAAISEPSDGALRYYDLSRASLEGRDYYRLSEHALLAAGGYGRPENWLLEY